MSITTGAGDRLEKRALTWESHDSDTFLDNVNDEEHRGSAGIVLTRTIYGDCTDLSC